MLLGPHKKKKSNSFIMWKRCIFQKWNHSFKNKITLRGESQITHKFIDQNDEPNILTTQTNNESYIRKGLTKGWRLEHLKP